MDGLNRRQKPTQKPSRPQSGRTAPANRQSRLKKLNPKTILAIAGIALLVASILVWLNSSSTEPVEPESLTPLEQAEDYYDPLIPDGRGKAEIDFHFDSEIRVFSFNDVYNDVPLIISQQPAPDNIKADPEELIDIARQMRAENSIDTNRGTAYITSEDDSSSQTAIFTADEILVFIQSSRILTFEEWQSYINDLSRY